jgi:hypothetical protein
MSQKMTNSQTSSFRSIVDAASLVFMHAALDAAVTDLCRLAAILAPVDWLHWLKETKVTLAEARVSSPESLLATKLESHLKTLDRESLLTRIDRLFALCKPEPETELITGYVFDRGRVEELDKLRQTVMHSAEGARIAIPDCESAIQFLFQTGLHLWAMLNKKYGVKMDPLHNIRKNPAYQYALHAMR